MILADIYFPALGEAFDFQLEEDVPIQELIEAVLEVMEKYLKGQVKAYAQGFELCSLTHKTVLPPSRTLRECGIPSGSRLMLL